MLFKNYKRCLSFALAWVLVVSLMPASTLVANAEENPTEETVFSEPAETTALEAEPSMETGTAAEPTEGEVLQEIQASIDDILTRYLGGTEVSVPEMKAIVTEMDWETYQTARWEISELDTSMRTMLESNEISEYALESLLNSNVLFCEFDAALEEKAAADNSVSTLATTNLSLFSGNLTITDDNGTTGKGNETDGVTIVTYGNATKTKKNTITFTNKASTAKVLKFTYSVTGSYDTYDFGTSGNQVEVTLAANGGTYVCSVTAKKYLSSKATLTLSNISFEDPPESSTITVNFDSSQGSVTVGGQDAASDVPVTGVSTSSETTIVAKPASGYSFLGWRNESTKAFFSTAATHTQIFGEDITLKAIFYKTDGSGTAYWGVGPIQTKRELKGNLEDGFFYINRYSVPDCVAIFDSLTAANTYAAANDSKGVVLLNSGTLPAGDYSVPSGISLLIPYDSGGTMYSYNEARDCDAPTCIDTYTTPTVHRKLILDSGVNLVVEGSMSVSADQSAKQSYIGAPTGPSGFVQMAEGSSITVSNGGKLHAWGYITGNGSVTVNAGATVYEGFQVRDFRGGDGTSDMAGGDNPGGTKVFPLSQYYVQNVEVPMTLMAGAVEHGYMSIDVTGVGIQEAGVPFVGSSGTMFLLKSGSLTKDYDEAEDRLHVTINGDISISPYSINIKISVLGSVTLNTTDYVLPINGNLTVEILNGRTLTLSQDIALLPGAHINIKQGATCTLTEGAKLFVYDAEDWSGYCDDTNVELSPIAYAPGKASNVTRNADTDASILINGTADATDGYVYSTSHGANIYSTETGIAKVNPDNATTVTYQATQAAVGSGYEITYVPISVTPAKLKNEDGNYVETASAAGTYYYNAEHGKWVKDGHTFSEKITTLATFTSAAVMTYTCTCGYEYTGEIDAAQVNGTNYKILSEAIAAADRHNKVTLLTDINGDVPVSKPVTISKGEYSANITAGDGYTLSTNGTDVTVLIKIVAANISAGDGLDMYFYVLEEAMTETGYQAVITRTIEGVEQEPITLDFGAEDDGWEKSEKNNKNYWRFSYRDIAAKEMTDTLTVVVNYADGTQATNTHTDSIRDYALRAFGMYGDKLDTALMDMLNYGAGAQDHFGYHTDFPANAADDNGIIEKYKVCATQEDAETSTEKFDEGVNLKGVSFSAKNKLMMTFYFKNISKDMTATISYTNHNGESLSWEVKGEDFYAYNNTLLGVDVKGLSVADGRCVVTCKVKDSTGAVVAYASDSVEGYVNRSNYPVMKLLMKFVDSAYAYFHP